MNVWRLQTETKRRFQYCLNKDVAAMGWGLQNLSQSEREGIETFDDYMRYADREYEQYYALKRLHNEAKLGDLIWMHGFGQYYIGRVSEESTWKFDASDEAKKCDASNQLTNIKWYKFGEGDESTIPGAINTSFIKGSAFQRINKSGVHGYSGLLYDKLVGTEYYNDIKLGLTESNFYSLLTVEDSEDLLALWLYKEHGYISIPSTNKISTSLYECILIDPKSGKHIYIQVKKGNVNIDANEYSALMGDVWFLTTGGKVENISDYSNMHVADPTMLYEFAVSEESDNILSKSIKMWVNLLNDQ